MSHPENSCTRHVGIDEVEVGMYVEDVFNDKGVLLLSANSMITRASQIERLKHQGVKSVFINIEKGSDVGDTAEIDDPQVRAAGADPLRNTAEHDRVSRQNREAAYFAELEKAREIHTETVQNVRHIMQAMRSGASFSTRPIKEQAENIVQSILRNPDALISLCQIKGYDEYTYVHSVNVGIFITSLARSMEYPEEQLVEIGMGGILHDIGKMKVPEHILNKPGRYTEAEFAVMKNHPDYGLAMVENRQNVSKISKTIIIQHHERYNGSGYPKGLKKKQISELGLISAVADVYDALTSDRVYRAAWPPQKALATIFQGCDTEYSRTIVELFTRHLGIYPVGSFVRLAGGEMGVVTRVDRGNLLAPVVLVLFNTLGQRLDEPVEYDLARKQAGEDRARYKILSSLNPAAYHVNIGRYISEKAG